MEGCTINGEFFIREMILGPNTDIVSGQGGIEGIIGEDSKLSL